MSHGIADFSKKLQLVLDALSASRSQLAHDLGVHKSLVARWVAGEVTPTEHNLSRLTLLIRQTRPDFSIAYGGWNNWGVVTLKVPLVAGENTFRVLKRTGYAEVDVLDDNSHDDCVLAGGTCRITVAPAAARARPPRARAPD